MIPKELRYSRTHEWVRVEGEVGIIGITRFAVDQLTDPVGIDLPKLGKTVQADKAFGEIESVKAVSDLVSPVTGEVIEINSTVKDDPGHVSVDPYGKGWMIKVRLSNPAEVKMLLTPEQYETQISSQDHH